MRRFRAPRQQGLPGSIKRAIRSSRTVAPEPWQSGGTAEASPSLTSIPQEFSTDPGLAVMDAIKPRMKELLGCNELEIYYYEYLREDFMHDPHRRDKFVGGYGLTESLGFVRYNNKRRNHGDDEFVGIGINMYETQGENPVRYIILAIPGPHGINESLVIPKGQTFRLHRQWQRQRANHELIKSPVLPDGFLEDIEKNTIKFLRNRRQFDRYGTSARRGIVLGGPPGNGKTMVCRYLRQRCDQEGIFYNVVSQSEIQAAFGQDRLDDVMNYDGVVFFDDIDISIFSRTGKNNELACALLAAMDGLDNSENCIRIFTTNEIMSEMDPAFKRPGRIDKVFHFKKPNAKMRRALLDTWPKELLAGVDIEEVTTSTKGFSFAEIDGIRNFMVTEHIIDGVPFDFNKALEQMQADIQEKQSGKVVQKTGRVGFTAEATESDEPED